MSRAMTTSHPSAAALPQPCHAPRLLVTRSHRLYFKLTVRREYSSPGRFGLYINRVARLGASAPRAACRRLLRLHHASRTSSAPHAARR
jgi:hypothetical protein